jgi:hypothetical protein
MNYNHKFVGVSMRRILLAIVCLFAVVSIPLSAALADYSFMQINAQYSELNNPTIVHQANVDDQMSAALDIGFNFVYDENVYSQFLVNSNGFVTLNINSTASYQNTLYYTPMIIAGFWDDLMTSAVNGYISYQLQGTAPFRRLVVQFKNMNWYYNAPNNLANFQISLNETSNSITFNYGLIGSSPSEYGSAAIGLSGSVIGNFVSVTPASPIAEVSSIDEFVSINGSHVPYLVGISYVFTPPQAEPNDLQAVSLDGNLSPVQGTDTEYIFRIRNRGTSSQSNYSIVLMDDTAVLLSIAGPFIDSGDILDVPLNIVFSNPGPVSLRGVVNLASDQNNTNDATNPLNVIVHYIGTECVTIGSGDMQTRIPIDFYYRNSLFECMYLSSEINSIGLITHLAFYNNFVTTELEQGSVTKIWLGETTQNDLSADWIPSTQLTQVFDGLVSYPPGQNTITITLSEAYAYYGNNLVMMVHRPMDSDYYSGNDKFFCQIEGTARARKVYADTYLFDPAAPPPVTPNGIYPKTSMFIVSQGYGNLTGTITNGIAPLEGVRVSLSGSPLSAITSETGTYSFPYVMQGQYEVTCSIFGYATSVQSIVVNESDNIVLDFVMTPLPVISFTGFVIGSDTGGIGLPGAVIELSGLADYYAVTNAQGQFIIDGIFANNTYNYVINKTGYGALSGSVTLADTDYNLGTAVLNELLYPPVSVIADDSNSDIALSWRAPNSNAHNITEGFEASFPPSNWSQLVTNFGSPNSLGVGPTWGRVGPIYLNPIIYPQEGSWQAAIWWSESHQDEWLITPQFVCPHNATLTFNGFFYLGESEGDHYYVKVSDDNGVSWDILWDSAEAGDESFSDYNIPLIISLSDYAYETIKLAWHADDPPTNDGMWHLAVIDNIIVNSATETIRFNSNDMEVITANHDVTPDRVFPGIDFFSKSQALGIISRDVCIPSLMGQRFMLGYKVWRLMCGSEQNENEWSLLTDDLYTNTAFLDTLWFALPDGEYRWAVRAVYTGNQYSTPAFSNSVVKQNIQGNVTGWVRSSGSVPITGAVISNGTYSATSNSSGLYSLNLPVGTYALTCSAEGYQPLTVENIVVSENQVTPCNFTMTTSNTDDVCVDRTLLRGNYPNPFNPETAISFDLKDRQRVRVEIFNVKGQLVRILVDEVMESCQHELIWNGRDSGGKAVASGIYHCRMLAGEYKASKRMMMLK